MSSSAKPGILGDYRDSCVVCMQGTDTGLAVEGEAEAGMALLLVLGIPMAEAGRMTLSYFAERYGCTEGMVPDGIITYAIRVCRTCMEKSGTGMMPGLLPTIPVYSHHGA